jgi:protein TonB
VQVELSSRAQQARQLSTENERVEVEVPAFIAPAQPVVEQPTPAMPPQPQLLAVARTAPAVHELLERELPRPEEIAVQVDGAASAVRLRANPIEAPLEPAPRSLDAPRRTALKADTVSAAASMALEQTTLGANVDELPRKLAINPSPVYPLDALLAGIEGRVVLRVLVSSQGGVLKIEMNRSSGSPSLDASAVAAVERWRFSPARRSGLPVEHEVLVPIRFTIRNG